jgi:DNA topoisomerase IB
MKKLFHNGVLIPGYEPKGLSVVVRGVRRPLPPEAEEMAIAFCKQPEERLDSVFVRNFMKDFGRALGLEDLELKDIDFSEVRKFVEEERAKKEALTREERKRLSEERKRAREENKQKYGFAIVDGERVEVNYLVEPPCIYVGRGKHPLRGRWKPRVHYRDIVLNLSPDAPTPPVPDGSEWGGREWDPDGLWIAKWRDKLTGKMKYVWLSETAPSRQRRSIEKFNLARKLGKVYSKVRDHIERGLESDDPLTKQIATAAYLIDRLKLRVGDEKDPEELDTCLPSGEFVSGINCSPIENLRYGDLVSDGYGGFTPVLKIFQRRYNGRIVRVYAKGMFPITVTADHPVLVAERKTEIGENFDFTAVKLKSADEIVPDRDYLVFPKLRTTYQNRSIDLGRYPMLEPRPCPQKLLLDEKLAWLLGVYLAEGSTVFSGKTAHIVFTFSRKESKIAKRVAQLVRKRFKRAVHLNRHRSVIRVRLHWLQLGFFLLENFGRYSFERRIPSFIMTAPKHIVRSFIRGYFEGDGYIGKSGRKASGSRTVHFTTTSKYIALQLQKLISKLGAFAQVRVKRGPMRCVVLGRLVKARECYEVIVGGKSVEKLGFATRVKKSKPQYYDSGDYFYVRVKEKETLPYRGKVFNIQTQTGFFEVSNIAVHNCGVTTLEKRNVKILSPTELLFDFLGKGAVRFRRRVELPQQVVKNLKEFIASSPNDRIFHLRSKQVNEFLAQVMPGLTSKVFRTYHATEVASRTLRKFRVYPGSPEFKKLYVAKRANLEAAKVLNHRRKLPKNWRERVEKQRLKVEELKRKVDELSGAGTARAERRLKALRLKLWEAKLKLKLMRKMASYNLSTSLNNYIDPRVYISWAEKKGLDWRKIYPKSMWRRVEWAVVARSGSSNNTIEGRT